MLAVQLIILCVLCFLFFYKRILRLIRFFIMAERKQFFYVVLLSFSFMFLFTPFQTQGNMQQVVIDSIKKEDPSFTGSGYGSLSIIYAVFSLANWLTPSILSFIGPKWTMFCGGLTYVLFMIGFLWPHTSILYLTSIFLGFGAALIWTGQGNYLTLMSSKETMGRNSGVFWALLQCSFLFGNIFVFFQFRGQEIIDHSTRLVVYVSLSIIGAIGLFIMLFLPTPGADGCRKDELGTPSQELRKAIMLFKTKEILLLAVTFFYTGIELSFFSGVYSACISFTMRFEDAKRLVGLSGIFIGLGEILGGAIFGIFGKKTVKFGRDPIILLGYIVHISCFYLIFINLPAQAPLGDTLDPSYLPYGLPNEYLALLCSFLLGFGDACYNTQIYSILGSVYSKNSGPAFAIFKFTQSLAAAICFFYASVLNLWYHLIIMTVLATLGTASFFIVEWEDFRMQKAQPDSALDEE